jgi:uncharacterized membrane protein
VSESSEKRDSGVERITAITDGVLAIAITLLVLNLDVPQVTGSDRAEELAERLWAMLPEFEIYLCSFAVIGFYWYSHHQMFKFIRGTDAALVWLNLAFLLPLTVLPFLSELASDYDDLELPLVLYFSVMGLTALIQTVMWWYASKNHRFIDPCISNKMIRHQTLKTVLPAVAFIFGILVSHFELGLARRAYLLIFLGPFIMSRYAPELIEK